MSVTVAPVRALGETHYPAAPAKLHQQGAGRSRDSRRPAVRGVLSFAYHWLLWLFFTLLLFGQAFGIAWTRASSHLHLYFGQDPALGVYQVLGDNDAPFTDRSFVCSLRGRIYKPVQLQLALDAPSALDLNGASANAVNGYRVVKRASPSQISESAMKGYENTCDTIASTMDAILDRCEELGYNVTRESKLRILVDSAGDAVHPAAMTLLPHTLPILVIPFSQNAFFSRYVVPGWDGSACMLRLNGAYETAGFPDWTFRSVNRSVREQRTVELLGKPGGVWRNGWYEDSEGSRWHSDVVTSHKTSLDATMREFDMLHGSERDCTSASSTCGKMIRRNWWGEHLSAADDPLPYTSVTILNAQHFGIFLFEASVERSIESVYNVEMILANFSLGALLFRWLLAQIAMLNSYRSGATGELKSVSIGVLSCARGFHWLPLFLLPRLKTNLAVFATIGCTFEGDQIALAQAWFLMYPGIAELLFFGYSLLNLAAKLLQRRASDALFGPTLVFFCAMHYARTDLAQSGWFEYDGRMPTVLTSDTFDKLSVLDFFRDGTLLKLNGNVKSLFFIKAGVLSLNLLPLLLFSRRTVCGDNSRSELLRLGYLVLDSKWLISIPDWYLLAATAPLRNLGTVAMRVMVFAVTEQDGEGGCWAIEKKPLLCRVSDVRLADCRAWEVSAHPFR